MDDRKGKGIMEHWNWSPSPRESTGSTEARATGAYGDEDGNNWSTSASVPPFIIRGNPGQNARRSAPVANQPHDGRPVGGVGQQLTLAAAPRGSTARHGAHSPGLQGQAQGSGNEPPQPRLCPLCHNHNVSVVFDNNMCGDCAWAAFVGPPPPSLPSQRQQPPHDLQEQWSPTHLALVANRPMGQQRGGAPAIQNLRLDLQGPPQAHQGPRDDEPLSTRGWESPTKQPPMPIDEIRRCRLCRVEICGCYMCIMKDAVCRACAPRRAAVPATSRPPQPNDQRPPRLQQPPPPVGAGVQQQLQHMAEHAATSRPVGERGGAPGEQSAAQLGLPGLQPPPQAHPVPRADKPVGFHYKPIVFSPGSDPEDGPCPACRHYPAPTKILPRRHVCLCYTCRIRKGMVCHMCASA